MDGGLYLVLQGNNSYTGATIINNAGVILTRISSEPWPAGCRPHRRSRSMGYVGGQVGILDLQNLLNVSDNR